MKKKLIVISLIFVTLLYAGKFSLADDLIKTFRKTFKFKGKISKELLETTISKYGDDFVKLSTKYGPDVFDLAKKYGDEGFEFINKYGDDGIRSIKNFGDSSFRFTYTYGDNIVKIMSKYGNTSPKLIRKYGDELIALNKKIPREKLIAITESTKLTNSSKLVNRVLKNGDQVISYIEKNPSTFKTMAITTAIFYVISDDKRFNTAINGIDQITETTVGTIADGAKGTIIGLVGGENNKATIIRSIIFSIGILFIIYYLLTKWNNKFLNYRHSIRESKKNEIKKGDINNETHE